MVYTAPEVFPQMDDIDYRAKGGLPYDKNVDIYSLSLVLHELFGGHGGGKFFPFSNVNNIQWSVLCAKNRRDPPKLKEELPIWPTTLQDAIRRGVDSDPQKRPSLKEFSEAIKVTHTRELDVGSESRFDCKKRRIE